MNRLDTKAQQEKLQYLSYRDALTNLYNRNRYMSVLENYGQNKGQLIRNVGVIYMDLNELKKVNDEQGHEAGDSYIRRAAQQIVAVFPEHTYRIGGDEFVIRLNNATEQDTKECMQRVKEALAAADKKTDIPISAAMGYAWSDDPDKDTEKLLQNADAQMYENKQMMKKSNIR